MNSHLSLDIDGLIYSKAVKIGNLTKVKDMFWIYYVSQKSKIKKEECGKWICNFFALGFVDKKIQEAINDGVVQEVKCSNSFSGVICFYLNKNDIEGHKRLLKYLLEKEFIIKNSENQYENICFKLDSQSRDENFKSEYILKLSDFIDLNTGEFLK